MTRWRDIAKRTDSLQKVDSYLNHIDAFLKKAIGVGMPDGLIPGSAGGIWWNFDAEGWQRAADAVLQLALKDAKQGTNHVVEWDQRARQGIRLLQGYDTQDWEALSRQEVLEHYDRWLEALDEVQFVIWVPVPAENALIPYAHDLVGDEDVWLRIVTSLAPSPEEQLRFDILNALKAGDADPKKLLAMHPWVGLRFVQDALFTVEDMEQRVAEVRAGDWRAELAAMEAKLAKDKTAFEKAIERFSKEEQQLLRIVNSYCTVRQTRDLQRCMLYYHGHFLFKEIARRNKMPVTHLLSYLVDEVRALLQERGKLPADEIKRRQESYLYMLTDGKVTLISDPAEVDRIVKKELGDEDLSDVTEVQGNVAMKGRVRGRVKVISLDKQREDLAALREGEIMVSDSTKPEHVPAIRRSAAIVTNEGGVTCHTAIVARELKKPCVIGTQHATKIFKDGDVIEVDAQKGIIRKV